jgi:hypothetical protein
VGVLEALRDAIDGLDPDALGCDPSDVAQLLRSVSLLQARALEAVGVFDAKGVWGADDATSAVAWLKHHGRLAPGTAAVSVQIARRLRVLPTMARLFADGTLSHDQVRTILAQVDDDLMALFAEHEAELAPHLARLDPHDLRGAMGQWRAYARAVIGGREPREDRRRAHLSQLPDGMWRLDATLGPEAGRVVHDAITHATTRDAEGEPERTVAQRRADALVDVCRWWLDHRDQPPRGRRRPHVDFVAPLDGGPGRDADGRVYDRATIERIACDAFTSRLLYGAPSHVLDYGHATRSVPAGLFRGLVLRDRHCRWPGCDRTADWCEAHHVLHWLRHGPTKLENLVLLCVRHHHHLHQPEWNVTLRADATLVIVTPTGRTILSRPAPILDVALVDTG